MKILPRIVASRLRGALERGNATRCARGRRHQPFSWHCPGARRLLRATRHAAGNQRIRFWRDPDGPEVDWIVEAEDGWLPVEVKWGEVPTARDARHLQTFLSEYPKAREGIVVCRTPRRFKIAPNVTAVPWQEIPDLVAGMA